VTESGRSRSFTFEGARSIDMPTVTVLYEITDASIIIHDALFVAAKYDPAGRV
jgi:hypothetical protein